MSSTHRAEIRAMLDKALADCQKASPRVKAQVTEICAGIEIATQKIDTRAKLADLRRYRKEMGRRPSATRQRRHFLTDPAEIAAKIADETGRSPDVIAETWERPVAQIIYQAIGARPGAMIRLDDLTRDDVTDIAWMMTVELADIDGDHIRLLSDCEESGRRYPGAPLPDARCKGRYLRGLAVEDIRDAWQAISDGLPFADIEPEQRQRMKSPHGIRISTRAMAYQANMLERALRDDECKCPGRETAAHAWELRGHEDGCRCLLSWVSVDTARRAVKTLTAEGVFVRTARPYLAREGHTAVGIPAAYYIPPDAGWHDYAEMGSPVRRHRRPSKLRRTLLAEDQRAEDRHRWRQAA